MGVGGGGHGEVSKQREQHTGVLGAGGTWHKLQNKQPSVAAPQRAGAVGVAARLESQMGQDLGTQTMLRTVTFILRVIGGH